MLIEFLFESPLNYANYVVARRVNTLGDGGLQVVNDTFMEVFHNLLLGFMDRMG